MPTRVFKAVQQNYLPTDETLRLLVEFRSMINDCLRVGLQENVTSLRSLSLRAYRHLAGYDAPSYYKPCAINVASGILRNYRKAKRKGRKVEEPYVRRLMLTTCYGFKIKDGNLLIPVKPKSRIAIPLNQHTIETVSDYEVRSVTLTPQKLSMAFAKTVESLRPGGLIGIDRNLDNITMADTTGKTTGYSLTNITRIKEECRQRKRNLTRNDVRIRQRLFAKYGELQRNRVQWILHNVSSRIVNHAKQNKHGIVMEDLKGIRRLYRRGNGQGGNYRAMLNGWSFAELQRQIEYKARWEGLPVIYVSPHGTSAKCSICGSRMARIPEKNRKLQCTKCGVTVDRDVNAARNILARGVRFAPVGLPSEAMMEERGQREPLILKVDGSQLTRHLPIS